MQIDEIEKTNIYIIENAFDNNLCDILINYINANNSNLIKYVFAPRNNVENYSVINIEKHIDIMVKDKMRELFKLVSNYNPDITVVGESQFELRKVYGRTRLHKDGIFDNLFTLSNLQKIKSIRSLTMVITLNDDFEGGIYDFPNQNVAFKPKKGTAICFPPYYTHPHSVSQVEQNKYRYICSAWGLDDFLIKPGESESDCENDGANECTNECTNDGANECTNEDVSERKIQNIWTYKNQKMFI
jgi:hypothetical protein